MAHRAVVEVPIRVAVAECQAVGVAHRSVSAVPSSAAQPRRRSQGQRWSRHQRLRQMPQRQMPRLAVHLSEVAVHENDECSARALHLLHQVQLAVLHAEAGDQVAGDAGTGRQAHRPCVEHQGGAAFPAGHQGGVGGQVAAPAEDDVLVGLLAH